MHAEGDPPPGGGPLPATWRRAAVAVVLFWAAVVAPLSLAAMELPGATTMQFTAPTGSAARRAADAEDVFFGGANGSGGATLVVLVRAREDISTSAAVADFSARLRRRLADWSAPRARALGAVTVTGRFLPPVNCSASGQQPAPCKVFGRALLSPRNTSTLLLVKTEIGVVEGQANDDVNDLIKWLRDQAQPGRSGLDPRRFAVLITGEMAINMDGEQGTIDDIERMETICLPFALAVLAMFLRSVRLMIIPVVAVGLTIATGFAAAYPIARQIKFITVTPSIMLSLSLALSIDYSLFLLMRFREGVEKGLPLRECLLQLRHTAHTVSVSGTLIVVAMFGMALVPCEPMRATGVGAGLSVAAAVLVSLSLTPALLALFGPWFADFRLGGMPCLERLPCVQRLRGGWRYAHLPSGDETDAGGTHVQLPSVPPSEEPVESKVAAARAELHASVWFRIASLTKRHPWVVIVTVCALGAPFYARVPSLRFDTLDGLELTPRDASSVTAYRALEEDFAPGLISPYRVLLVERGAQPPSGGGLNLSHSGVFTREGYEAMGRLAARLVAAPTPSRIPPLTNDSFSGATFVPGDLGSGFKSNWVSFDAAQDLLNAGGAVRSAYEAVLAETVSQPEHGAAKLLVSLTVRPMGDDAGDWLDIARGAAAEFEAAEGGRYEVHITGAISTMKEFARLVDDSLPLMFGVIIACVVVLVAAFFRSLAIPLRLAFALVYTVAVTFGAAWYFFQSDFGRAVMPYLSDFKSDAIQWLVPPLSVTVTVALGLDYDIFLLTRIIELRKDGRFTDEASILRGVYHTGWIISGAGVIMAIAFFGLILSKVVVLNQFGVILCVSVLLDTFVIRTVLLPALMFALGGRNWWPRTFPAPLYGVDYFPSATHGEPELPYALPDG